MAHLNLTQPSGREAAWAAIFGDDTDARSNAARAAATQSRELVEDGELALVLGAAAATPRAQSALTLARRAQSPEADQTLLAQWDGPPEVRQGAFAAALRLGLALEGSLQDFVLAELDVLDPDDPAHVRDIAAALHLLADVAPDDALDAAGICAPVIARALDTLPADPQQRLINAYADRLAEALGDRDALPEPASLHGLLALDLLGAPFGGRLLTEVASRLELDVARVAGRLAHLSAAASLQAALQGDSLGGNPGPDAAWSDDPSERVDASILRGLLDHHQLAYEDITGDVWEVRLNHRDEFGQRVRSLMRLGLTARRVTFRLTEPVPTPQDPAAFAEVLRAHHYAGLARFSLDTSNRLCLSCEVPREGFTNEAFTQCLDDLRAAVEKALGTSER